MESESLVSLTMIFCSDLAFTEMSIILCFTFYKPHRIINSDCQIVKRILSELTYLLFHFLIVMWKNRLVVQMRSYSTCHSPPIWRGWTSWKSPFSRSRSSSGVMSHKFACLYVSNYEQISNHTADFWVSIMQSVYLFSYHHNICFEGGGFTCYEIISR